METKKNSKFDLESKRRIFFFYGLIITLTAVLLSFKNGSEVKEIYIPEIEGPIIVDVVDVPRTNDDKPLVVPPPMLKLFDKVNIVDNGYKGPDIDIDIERIEDPIPLPLPKEEPEQTNKPLDFAEFMPEFPGGNKNLNIWLSKNLVYPDKAQKLNLAGRVYVRFVVGKDGSISEARVTRGVDPLLDEEALRVIKAMPKWKPGMQNGQLVNVSYNIYVSFKLN